MWIFCKQSKHKVYKKTDKKKEKNLILHFKLQLYILKYHAVRDTTVSALMDNSKNYLNLSWPAVSHNCNFILVPSLTSISRAKKSTPTVGSDICNISRSGKLTVQEILLRQDQRILEIVRIHKVMYLMNHQPIIVMLSFL